MQFRIAKVLLIVFTFLINIPFSKAQIDGQDVNKTPYGVIYNHLYYLQSDSYDPAKAARSFQLPQEEAEDAAIKLKQILDGEGLYVDINRLPQKRNYVDTTSGESIYFIERNEPLIYVEKTDSLWFYSRTTVNNIDKLHSEIYPLGTFLSEWFQKPVWQNEFLGIQLWQWIGLLGLLVIGFIVFFLLSKIVLPLIKRLVGLQFGKMEQFQKDFKSLARLISLAITTKILSYLLPMLMITPRVNSFLIKGLGILFLFFLIFIFTKLMVVVFHYLGKITAKTENPLDDQLLPVLHKIANGIIWVVGGIYILDYLDVNVTALLAGISIGGLALALAAQDTVKNFFGSLMIFVDQPFKIGDWINFDNVDGVVEEVGLRSTRIRTFANSIITVPNGNLANIAINNYGMRRYRRFTTKIGVTYDTPPELITIFVDGIKEIIQLHPTSRKDYFEVHLNEFGASSLNILLYMFFDAPTWTDELKGRHEIMAGVIQLASDLGVRFAFPTQTLHIEEIPGQNSLTPKPKTMAEAKAQMEKSLKNIDQFIKTRKGTDPTKFKPLGGE
ncbi:MAG: mechanosensitive ion channel family protein [Saprospiraceae bacterium]